jgi:hypothetical protein
MADIKNIFNTITKRDPRAMAEFHTGVFFFFVIGVENISPVNEEQAGGRKMNLRCTLALCVMLAVTLGRVKEKQHNKLQSLVWLGPESHTQEKFETLLYSYLKPSRRERLSLCPQRPMPCPGHKKDP